MSSTVAKTMFRPEWIELGDGQRMHVEVGGRGAPLLILHGFTGSTRTVQDIAERLAPWHRTIRVDLAGHGLTHVLSDAARFGMSGATADLARVLDHVLPAPPRESDGIDGLWEVPDAHILGYSMGGRLALGLAAYHPERVRSLVLVGASPGIADAGERERRREADAELAELLLRDGITAFVDRWMRSDFFETQREMGSADWEEKARAQRLDNQPLGLAMSLRAMGTGAQPPLHDRLPDIDVPVLLVVGDRDPKFVGIAEEMAAALPDARVEVLSGAGHAVHLEQPEVFAERVQAFLAECEMRDSRPEPVEPEAVGQSSG